MPWCEQCDKFWPSSEVGADLACPDCGEAVSNPSRRVPWHFKVMLVAFAGYMVYRIYWLVEWLPKHI